MNNGYKVEWSVQAVTDFNGIVDFLTAEWGEKFVRRFVQLLDKELQRICLFPYAFPTTDVKPGVRRCVFSMQHTLYYMVENKVIYLIAIFDNRQDPERLSGIL